jgi:hypothetical protein
MSDVTVFGMTMGEVAAMRDKIGQLEAEVARLLKVCKDKAELLRDAYAKAERLEAEVEARLAQSPTAKLSDLMSAEKKIAALEEEVERLRALIVDGPDADEVINRRLQGSGGMK